MCKLESIFIIDDENKLCDEMRYLRPAVIRRIKSNIIQIQKTDRHVRVCCMYDNPSDNEAFIKSNGYTEEQCLYDKLIIEHNNNYPNNVLWRWPRPDENK